MRRIFTSTMLLALLASSAAAVAQAADPFHVYPVSRLQGEDDDVPPPPVEEEAPPPKDPGAPVPPMGTAAPAPMIPAQPVWNAPSPYGMPPQPGLHAPVDYTQQPCGACGQYGCGGQCCNTGSCCNNYDGGSCQCGDGCGCGGGCGCHGGLLGKFCHGGCGCGDDCGCGHGCGCGPCVQPCYIYARADLIFMTRSRANTRPLATQGVNGPALLTTRDLSFRWEPVARLLIGMPLSDEAGVEVSYLGFNDWISRANVTAFNPTLFTPFSNFGVNPAGGVAGIDPARLVQAAYSSRLHTAELNFTYIPCLNVPGCLTILNGVRWYELNERFDVATTSPGNFAVNTRTTNDMIGYQFGLRWEFDLTCRLHAIVEPKVGVFANIATQRTSSSIGAFTEFARRDEVSLGADGNVRLSYDICPWLSFNVGYNMIVLNGVATAPNNFRPQPLPAANAGRLPALNNRGTVLFQGGSLGLEARF